jgi:hypothetical protein
MQKCGHEYKRTSDAMWETLSRCQNGDKELAWGGGTNIENKHEEFFTPSESLERGEFEPSKVDHNLKVNNLPRPPRPSTYLKVNSCSHAIVVEQLMSLVRTLEQVPASNKLKVQKTHHKKPQLGNASTFVNRSCELWIIIPQVVKL